MELCGGKVSRVTRGERDVGGVTREEPPRGPVSPGSSLFESLQLAAATTKD